MKHTSQKKTVKWLKHTGVFYNNVLTDLRSEEEQELVWV
jgi:hypothetical protein